MNIIFLKNLLSIPNTSDTTSDYSHCSLNGFLHHFAKFTCMLNALPLPGITAVSMVNNSPPTSVHAKPVT